MHPPLSVGVAVESTRQGARETTYSYDAVGRLSTLTAPDGHASTRDYDDAGHVLGIDYVGGSDDVEFTYDALGQRLTMADASGTTTYTYSGVGQVLTVENGDGQSLAYDYDGAGQLLTITYPGNHDVDYTYDGAGQLTSVTGWASGVSEFTYTDDGRLETRSDPNGIDEQRSYDAAGNLTGIDDSLASTRLVGYSYSYDDAGQVVRSTLTDGLHSASDYSWGYDEIGQLTTTSPSTAYSSTPGGRLEATAAGDSLAYNSAGQVTSMTTSNADIAFDYDDNRARITAVTNFPSAPDATSTYEYSAGGALEGFDDGSTVVRYVSDGDGLRQQRSVGVTD